MKKFILLLAVCSILCVPVFADNDPSFVSTFQLTQLNGSNPWYVTTYETDTAVTGDVYFYAKVMQGNSNILELYAISETQNARAIATVVNVSNNATNHEYFTCNSHTSDYYFSNRCTYWQTNTNSYVASPALSAFPDTATNADIASAFDTFLNTPQTPTVSSNFNVPCGNVVYFQVTTEQDVTFKSYNQILSSILNTSSYGPWGDTGQRFGPASSLPSSGTSFPLLSQDPIHWNIDASSVNLLGQSRTAIKSVHCIANQWYAFYNPAYNSNNTDWTVNDITGATVGIYGSFSQIKVYPLEQVVDFSNGAFVGSSNDDYQSYYDGTIGSDGTVTFTDQDGNISTPSAGGQNLLAPNESYQSLIDRVIGILDEIVHELKSLFTFGYDAIQSLVNIMSDFVNVFQQLYTWLPSEVYTALVSAIIVAITIGVFKVFL